MLQKEAGTKFSDLGRRGVVLSVYRKNAADQLCSFGTVYLRLCFRICKKPVFSRGGSDKNTCQIAYSGVLFTSCVTTIKFYIFVLIFNVPVNAFSVMSEVLRHRDSLAYMVLHGCAAIDLRP